MTRQEYNVAEQIRSWVVDAIIQTEDKWQKSLEQISDADDENCEEYYSGSSMAFRERQDILNSIKSLIDNEYMGKGFEIE